MLLHLFLAPYTKVEESFNLQAIHDILAYGIPLKDAGVVLAADYDHVSYPGAVPRSLVGAVLLAGLSSPWLRLLREPKHIQLLGECARARSKAKGVMLIKRSARYSGLAQCRRSTLIP